MSLCRHIFFLRFYYLIPLLRFIFGVKDIYIMMYSFYSISEALAISRAFFRAEKLRTFLTCMVIAVGIASLTGSVMAVKALSDQIAVSFNRLGANLVSVQPAQHNINGRKLNPPYIAPSHALAFSMLCLAESESVYEHYSQPINVSYGENKVSNAVLIAAEPAFFALRNLGNSFNAELFSDDVFVCVLSNSLARRLSIPSVQKSFYTSVSILSFDFAVVGLADETSYNPGSENFVIVPYSLYYRYIDRSQNIQIDISSPRRSIQASVYEDVESSMRSARRLRPYDENDFSVSDNRLISTHSAAILQYISRLCIAVAAIALIGASVALMNTLLVGVNARKREIGLYMALGANKSFIRLLFFSEAFLYGTAGGLSGVLAGLLVGYPVSAVLTSDYTLPVGWILFSFVVSLSVCLLSSCIPSEKAAKLSPVKALSSR